VISRRSVFALFPYVALFLGVFFLHGTSRVTTENSDSRWSLYAAHSLIHEGNLELSEFESDITKAKGYCIHRVHGRPYNLFPPIPSLVAVPFVLLVERYPAFAELLLPGIGSLEKGKEDSGEMPGFLSHRGGIERAAASAITALTAVLILVLARGSLGFVSAIGISLLFSFGTSAWSVASRSLWQHGPSMLLVTLALVLITRGPRSLSSSAALGGTLALAYIARPTNAPFALLLILYLLLYHRAQVAVIIAAFSGVLALFAAWSWDVYGTFLPPYYQPTRLVGTETFIEAFWGNLISPGRGIFVYSPVFLFACWGAVLHLRRSTDRPLCFFILTALVLHTTAVSLLPHWWGGFAYGPRFMSDMIPLFMYLLIPVAYEIEQRLKARQIMMPAMFLCVVVLSIWMHMQGATNRATQRWDKVPRSIDQEPARLWSWSSPSFLARKDNLHPIDGRKPD
jgi:hypothetical protein